MARRPRKSLSCSAAEPATTQPGGIDPRALLVILALVLVLLVLWRR